MTNKEKYKDLISKSNRLSKEDFFQYLGENYPDDIDFMINYPNIESFVVYLLKKQFKLAYPTMDEYWQDKNLKLSKS